MQAKAAWVQFYPPEKDFPGHRECHRMLSICDKVWLFGGNDKTMQTNDVHVFDAESLSWTKVEVSGPKPKPRSANAATAWGSKILVSGGWDGQVELNDLHVFDTKTGKWSEIITWGDPPCIPCPRHFHSIAALGDLLLVFGGYTGRNWLNDLHCLHLPTRKWIPVQFMRPAQANQTLAQPRGAQPQPQQGPGGEAGAGSAQSAPPPSETGAAIGAQTHGQAGGQERTAALSNGQAQQQQQQQQQQPQATMQDQDDSEDSSDASEDSSDGEDDDGDMAIERQARALASLKRWKQRWRPSRRASATLEAVEEQGMVFLLGGYDGHYFLSDLWAIEPEMVMPPSGSGPGSRSSDPASISASSSSSSSSAAGAAASAASVDAGSSMSTGKTRAPIAIRAHLNRIGGGRLGPKRNPLDRTDHRDLLHGDWPPPRSGHACTVSDGLMYVVGGRHSGGRRNDLFVYDPKTEKWTHVPPVSDKSVPKERKTHSIAVSQGWLFLFGGHDGKFWRQDHWMVNLGGIQRAVAGAQAIKVPRSTISTDMARLLPFEANDSAAMERLRDAEDELHELVRIVEERQGSSLGPIQGHGTERERGGHRTKVPGTGLSVGMEQEDQGATMGLGTGMGRPPPGAQTPTGGSRPLPSSAASSSSTVSDTGSAHGSASASSAVAPFHIARSPLSRRGRRGSASSTQGQGQGQGQGSSSSAGLSLPGAQAHLQAVPSSSSSTSTSTRASSPSQATGTAGQGGLPAGAAAPGGQAPPGSSEGESVARHTANAPLAASRAVAALASGESVLHGLIGPQQPAMSGSGGEPEIQCPNLCIRPDAVCLESGEDLVVAAVRLGISTAPAATGVVRRWLEAVVGMRSCCKGQASGHREHGAGTDDSVPAAPDVLVRVAGCDVALHWMVLALRCEFFRTAHAWQARGGRAPSPMQAMERGGSPPTSSSGGASSSGGVVTSGQDPSRLPVVELPGTRLSAFLIVARYLYCDSLPTDDALLEHSGELLELAGRLGLHRLQRHVEGFLSHRMHCDNAADLLSLADDVGADELKERAIRCILGAFDHVVMLPSFVCLRADLLKEVLFRKQGGMRPVVRPASSSGSAALAASEGSKGAGTATGLAGIHGSTAASMSSSLVPGLRWEDVVAADRAIGALHMDGSLAGSRGPSSVASGGALSGRKRGRDEAEMSTDPVQELPAELGSGGGQSAHQRLLQRAQVAATRAAIGAGLREEAVGQIVARLIAELAPQLVGDGGDQHEQVPGHGARKRRRGPDGNRVRAAGVSAGSQASAEGDHPNEEGSNGSGERGEGNGGGSARPGSSV